MQIVTYAGHGVQYTRGTHTYAHSRLPSQVSICCCCVYRRLLVPEADEWDAKIHAFLTNVNHWKSWKTEEHLNAQIV